MRWEKGLDRGGSQRLPNRTPVAELETNDRSAAECRIVPGFPGTPNTERTESWRHRQCDPPEVRWRAVRVVPEHQGEHDPQWVAIGSIAAKIGCTAETIRKGVRQVPSRVGPTKPADGEQEPSLNAFFVTLRWRTSMRECVFQHRVHRDVGSLQNRLSFVDESLLRRHRVPAPPCCAGLC